jgi:hypothetical protein
MDEKPYKAMARRNFIGVFSCGLYEDGAVFAVRYTSKRSGQDGRDCYILTHWW